MVGSVMVGVLATKSADPTIARNGLAYGGGADQLLAQLLGVGVAGLYSAVLTALILIFVRRAFRSCGGLRVTAAEELAGLVSRTCSLLGCCPLIAGPPAALGSDIPSKIRAEFVLKRNPQLHVT